MTLDEALSIAMQNFPDGVQSSDEFNRLLAALKKCREQRDLAAEHNPRLYSDDMDQELVKILEGLEK